MNETDSLLEKWLQVNTHQEKATIENQIWEVNKKPSTIRRDFLVALLGVKPSEVEDRFYILNGGKDGEVLWPLIESKRIGLRPARNLLALAKAQSKTKSRPVSECLKQLIEYYEKQPVITQSKTGAPTRKMNWDKTPVADPSDVWDELRKSVELFVDKQLASGEQVEREKLKAEISVEVRTLIDSIKGMVSRARSKNQKRVDVSSVLKNGNDELKKAFEVLRMDPPENGSPIDIKLANTQKRRLARLFHPDVAGDTPENNERYKEVMQAFNTLMEASGR